MQIKVSEKAETRPEVLLLLINKQKAVVIVFGTKKHR